MTEAELQAMFAELDAKHGAPTHWDRDGNPLGSLEWARRFDQADYRQVDATTLPNGFDVSTVWLGLDHRFHDEGPPIIFETMVFGGGMRGLDQWRYSTISEARAGHLAMCARWSRRPHLALYRGLAKQAEQAATLARSRKRAKRR